MNSTFRARWLASSEVISQVIFHLRAAEEKQNGFCWHIVTNQVALWAASYSACVVYTKTIIHLSVGESGVYLPPLRWIIVNYYYYLRVKCLHKKTHFPWLHVQNTIHCPSWPRGETRLSYSSYCAGKDLVHTTPEKFEFGGLKRNVFRPHYARGI